MKFKCEQCGACCRQVGKFKHKEVKALAISDKNPCCYHYDNDTGTCPIYVDRPVYCNVERTWRRYFKKDMTKQQFFKLNKEFCIKLRKMEKG